MTLLPIKWALDQICVKTPTGFDDRLDMWKLIATVVVDRYARIPAKATACPFIILLLAFVKRSTEPCLASQRVGDDCTDANRKSRRSSLRLRAAANRLAGCCHVSCWSCKIQLSY
eukprot:4898277-Pleurochrysis_carterae.AAC.2